MTSLNMTRLTPDQRPTGVWSAALLHSLAREEARGRRAKRLTEVGMATWNRFRGRLKARDLLALVFEDAAVGHRIPFDPAMVNETGDGPIHPDLLPDYIAEEWLREVPSLDLLSQGSDYVLEQARLLGVPTRMARSDLYVVKPHHQVLELPGTGGQLAHYLASTHPKVTLQDNFTVACGGWRELTLAGIVAVDLGAPHSDFVVRVATDHLKDPDHLLRQQRFDFVVGLHPERGGLFRAENQLAIWFPNATLLLV